MTLYIIILLVLFVVVVINLPVFGRLPKGERQTKIRELPIYRNGALQNNSLTPMQPEGVSFLTVLNKFLFGKHPQKIPSKALSFIKPDLNTEPKSSSPEIIWFGHSSYLIKINDKRILVDPIFSITPSPFSFIGSKAFPGTNFVKAEEFLNIDVLVITHDHYDHLDYQTILKIAPQIKSVVTSIGVGAHLERWGIEANKIYELCWEQSISLHNDLKFTAVSARHFTGRKFKRNQTLWSAFVLEVPNYRMFLGGDSGYDTHFKQIGDTYGPFDIALLECGQYNELWPYIHMFPEQTIQAAIDLNAKILMPVHWGKFTLAMHPWNEPIERVKTEAEKRNLQITTPKLGETVSLSENFPVQKWWLD
ncbi:MBL fold metallo-hydrolase [Pedobacter jejuensis]|uniref:MBL fold metallo-hydrolase n=1 Tax=Pedobacter jejuensis TaxID=1268550 RepID=A0A3N0BT94_9SPHI|nr:MBL fold metallo-hydrolase [Pedobacter jejuensis]RNL52238.1 MBL fold metallo-hydrolase [Pedobacter jejuensis]